MNLLLDTHVALWVLVDSPRLGREARRWLTAERSTAWVSAASLWEIAIKHSLGRGDMPVSPEQALEQFRASGLRILPVQPEHAVAVAALPPIHADPFDRLLVAQALTEPMRLMTHDALIAHYSETVILI
ncbi:MAG: type II toxin-antitoxin system VapC family toxin [Burkholderiaceae bacterium]|nr:type II toxin-antitoxin system VapC family toxin [Burkholderiaceae bacterium]MCZ8175588.1 type II toxin-antitoxin system VapC family toxin [Burkholderiaceae bacterium]